MCGSGAVQQACPRAGFGGPQRVCGTQCQACACQWLTSLCSSGATASTWMC